MDLNKLFANVNNSGIQLEQADLVKFRLLEKIKSPSEKHNFDLVWQSCEHMDSYFERNVRVVFKNIEWSNSLEFEQLSEFSDSFIKGNFDTSNNDNSNEGLTIEEIVSNNINLDKTNNLLEKRKDGFEDIAKAGSIISFPLLLIHTLRAYNALHNKADINCKLHADRLIETFKPLFTSTESEIKDFFDCLWRVRYIFDVWCAKWVENEESNTSESHLSLTHISASSSNNIKYFNRTKRDNITDLTQLQAVLRYTGDFSAQYWLTPFLTLLIKDEQLKNISKETLADVTRILESIDNQLSLTNKDTTQKEASFDIAKGDTVNLESFDVIEAYLKGSHGTKFKHYWFQKLEYVLLKKAKDAGSTDTKLGKYRITSKNSIEHVHPQNEEYGNVIEKNILDSFGNLALLNPSQNSSYSNQKVEKKKIDFYSKDSYDSLKLKLIFDFIKNNSWNETAIKEHEEDFINYLKDYYQKATNLQE